MNNKSAKRTDGNGHSKEANTRTFFLLFFPTIILSVIPSSINGTVWEAIAIKLLIVFYQFVVIKNFVNVHYKK